MPCLPPTFRPYSLTVALATLFLAACGDSGGATTQTTADPTGDPTSAPGTTTDPTSGGATDTPGTTPGGTGTQSDSDGPTSASETDPTTTSPATTDTTATGSTTDPGETTDPSGSSTTSESESESGGEVVPCKTDAECTLVDDCCSCEPIGPGEAPPTCDIKECLINTCSPLGLEGAPLVCRFGRCTFEKVQCNPLGVDCNAIAPECPAGQIPSVEDTNEGRCWTGQCVPAEACDWVPDCSYCDEQELVCVFKLQKGAYTVCDTKPTDCGDVDEIDCACGQQICDASPPHTICADADDGIMCECPFC